MIYNLKILNSVLSNVQVKTRQLLLLISLIFLLIVCEIISLSVLIPFVSTIFSVENKFLEIFLAYSNEENLLLVLLAVLIFFIILKTVFALYTRWYICTFSYSQFAKIQRKLLFNYFKLDSEKFHQRNSSDYVASVRELSAHTISFLEAILKILAEIIVVFFIFGFLLFLNFKILIYISLVFIPIIFFYNFFLKPINFRLGSRRNEAIKNLYKEVQSSIEGYKEIKILDKTNFFLNNLFRNALVIKDVQQKTVLINESPRYIFELSLLLFGSISIFVLSLSNENIISQLPTLSVFLLAGVRILPSISFIVSNLNRAAELLPSTLKIESDLKSKLSSKQNLRDNINEISEFKSLKMENVKFFYENSNLEILENVNFSINKKECIGLIGKSGSGKTTFVDIILGLLPIKGGKIYLNGGTFNQKNNFFFGNVAYLPQSPVILDESIITNIALEKNTKEIDMKKVLESIEISNLTDLVNSLPKKFNTPIGENGIRLSIGQSKRLAIARTFYHGKNFIIMDEATSSQDKENQDLIANQIKKIKGKFTILIISHQMDVLKYCDKIFKVENKKIYLEI